jgi:hypothetical protein
VYSADIIPNQFKITRPKFIKQKNFDIAENLEDSIG